MGDESCNPADAGIFPPEVVVFLDANMPNLDQCNGKCAGKELVFCKHKFIFSAEVVHSGRALDNLDDFQVLECFFKLIRSRDNWRDAVQKPIFILVTKDLDFLKDARRAYQKVAKKRNGKPIFNSSSNYVCDGELKVIIKLINCKNYGTNRQNDFRCTIKILNDFWKDRQDSR